ncbi:TetR/AcrR family transcriptional regulator [Streptomyces sp. NPDC001406]|uniref:TetR/AcrR family transcriptional regulator n=1 Tax=Streptomyces sp. NPDC001406 TaxID=3364572 RepID=UPI0036BC299F
MERRRVILETAEALLGEQGYDSATLKAIGERVGIPTASVYHYFSDRHQIDSLLAQRHELEARVGASLSSRDVRTLHDAVDAVIDPTWDYLRRHPSCVELWFAGEVADIVRAYDEAQAMQVLRVLVERGLLPVGTPPLVMQVAWETGHRLFEVAFRRTPTGTLPRSASSAALWPRTSRPMPCRRRGHAVDRHEAADPR